MRRTAYVSTTPVSLRHRPAPTTGSLEQRLSDARKIVIGALLLPIDSAARRAINQAIRDGKVAFDAGSGLGANPYPERSPEAHAWLLAWHTRSREELV